MWWKTVIRSRLDGYADAFGRALFSSHNCLINIACLITRKSVVQLADEFFTILRTQTHECAAHYDILDFVDAVAEIPNLVYSTSSLLEGIVTRADCTHTRRFISGVRLSTVFEVRVWATWTVDTYVAGIRNVRTSMRLAHHRDYGNATRTSNRLRNQLG